MQERARWYGWLAGWSLGVVGWFLFIYYLLLVVALLCDVAWAGGPAAASLFIRSGVRACVMGCLAGASVLLGGLFLAPACVLHYYSLAIH